MMTGSYVQPVAVEKFSASAISQQIQSYLRQISMDLKKDFKWDRKSISDFMDQKYGVKLSHMMATEAFISCELSEEQKKSEPDLSYNKEQLIRWIQINVPSLQSLEKHKQKIQKRREVEKMSKLVSQQNIERRYMHDSVRKQLLDSKDDLLSEINPIEEESLTNMKQVGKSMFIINNREATKTELPAPTPSAFTTSLKEKIQQCVEYAEKKPSMRKKLVESMLDLEH